MGLPYRTTWSKVECFLHAILMVISLSVHKRLLYQLWCGSHVQTEEGKKKENFVYILGKRNNLLATIYKKGSPACSLTKNKCSTQLQFRIISFLNHWRSFGGTDAVGFSSSAFPDSSFALVRGSSENLSSLLMSSVVRVLPSMSFLLGRSAIASEWSTLIRSEHAVLTFRVFVWELVRKRVRGMV